MPPSASRGGNLPAASVIPAGTSADDPDVFRLGSLLALGDVELDLLPFLQAASQDKEFCVLEGRHIGMLAGAEARQGLWLKVHRWLEARSQ